MTDSSPVGRGERCPPSCLGHARLRRRHVANAPAARPSSPLLRPWRRATGRRPTGTPRPVRLPFSERPRAASFSEMSWAARASTWARRVEKCSTSVAGTPSISAPPLASTVPQATPSRARQLGPQPSLVDKPGGLLYLKQFPAVERQPAHRRSSPAPSPKPGHACAIAGRRHGKCGG